MGRAELLIAGLFLLFLVNARGQGDGGIKIEFLEFPRVFSSSAAAAFEFNIVDGKSGDSCGDCAVNCKLDEQTTANCLSGRVNFSALQDGPHKFQVCAGGSRSSGLVCADYKWTVDTIPPTASISVLSSFTSAENVGINITFSESCSGLGGFRCSPSDCNLLVYGWGRVLHSTLKILQPGLKYSLIVNIPKNASYGRLVLAMEKNFCSDNAGNLFTRTENSTLFLRYDRRNVEVDVATRIPRRLVPVNGVQRSVEATNDDKNLRVYVNFSVPVVNSSAEILRALKASSGLIVPTSKISFGNRRFTFMITNVSTIAVVTLKFEAASILSRQGTSVLPAEPVTFLYDTRRPAVTLSSWTGARTSSELFPVLVKFGKPVFGFNSSGIEILGGNLESFREVSRSTYLLQVRAYEDVVSLNVLENKTADIAGNLNLASSTLYVRHYSTPIISSISSGVITAIFLATCLVAALLSISTARLLSADLLPQQSSYFISEPTRNLVRVAFHIQVFAQSRWLGIGLPVEFYEFARGLQWSIPYLRLPWESRPTLEVSGFSLMERAGLSPNDLLYGTPLTAMEYTSFFEDQSMKPEAGYIVRSQGQDGWTEFGRNMFWLAISGGGLAVLHLGFLLLLKLQKEKSAGKNKYGALALPRFELFLAFLAVPCICQASASIIIRGPSPWSTFTGVVLLFMVGSATAALLVFVSAGISLGRLLEYKEVHQVGQKFHCLQELVRVTLGPGKRGQWTWKKDSNSPWLPKLGPLFEDLRGPPKYMLSQFTGSGRQQRRGGALIDSDDETEDAEAPFLQKLFGILRIYYPVLDTLKRVAVATIAGAANSKGPSKGMVLICLVGTSFQLFFLVLKKPFIKKKAQLAEILAMAAEVVVFGCCLGQLRGELSRGCERRIGVALVALVVAVFWVQMGNAWYALWKQVRRLSGNGVSFFLGLQGAALGLVLFFFPSSATFKEMAASLSSPVQEGGGGGGERNASGQGERPWLRQLREMAKASFSRDDVVASSSSTVAQSVWGGLWSGKRSRSTSITSSLDSKARPSKALDKDLEAIFTPRSLPVFK
ncbi:uncharacterized protein LOC144700744 [Wolffia australiana]